MDTINTNFVPYQYKPVLTFLESLLHGILIADEVGLGKIIEAGLIRTALRACYERQARSAPLVEAFGNWLKQQRARVSPKLSTAAGLCARAEE